MAVTLVWTVGAVDANSFMSETEMERYVGSLLRTGIVYTGTDAQQAAMVEATRDLNLLPWAGARSSATQALAWPRIYAENPDLVGVATGLVAYSLDAHRRIYDFPTNVVPQRVKDAACELAVQYLIAGTNSGAADANMGVIEKTVGPLTTKWQTASARATGWRRFPRVVQLVRPLLRGQPSTVLSRA